MDPQVEPPRSSTPAIIALILGAINLLGNLLAVLVPYIAPVVASALSGFPRAQASVETAIQVIARHNSVWLIAASAACGLLLVVGGIFALKNMPPARNLLLGALGIFIGLVCVETWVSIQMVLDLHHAMAAHPASWVGESDAVSRVVEKVAEPSQVDRLAPIILQSFGQWVLAGYALKTVFGWPRSPKTSVPDAALPFPS